MCPVVVLGHKCGTCESVINYMDHITNNFFHDFISVSLKRGLLPLAVDRKPAVLELLICYVSMSQVVCLHS